MKKTHIIAEMAWGHNGSVKQAKQIAQKAKECGADSVSIHITDMESTMVKHYGNGKGKVSAGRESVDIYKYLDSINLKNSDWLDFYEFFKELGLELVVMPNDFPSLEFSEKHLKPDYYVVSAACFVEEEFLNEIATLNRKTFFRIGGAYLGEIEKAINIFRKKGNNKVVLLHGFQNYPTELKEINISQLKNLKNIFGCEVGLAEHIDGSDSLSEIIPILAIAYEATFIEKHITLNRDNKSEDFESALNPQNFYNFVRNIRATEDAIGKSVWDDLNEATLRYRNISRKRIVAHKDIKAGDIITRDKIVFKRSDVGIEADMIYLLIGRITKYDIKKDESITTDKLK